MRATDVRESELSESDMIYVRDGTRLSRVHYLVCLLDITSRHEGEHYRHVGHCDKVSLRYGPVLVPEIVLESVRTSGVYPSLTPRFTSSGTFICSISDMF